MIEIPNLPKVFHDGHVSKEGAKLLLQWKEAFKRLGYDAQLEEGSGGAVTLEDDDLLHAIMDAAPVDATESPWVEIYLSTCNKGDIFICIPTTGFDTWVEKIEEAGSPVKKEPTYGTWEEIYNLAAKYVEFRNSMIPPVPEHLLG